MKSMSPQFKLDCNYLSSIFLSVEGFTIEHSLIQLKIEKVKELLFYMLIRSCAQDYGEKSF